MGGGVIVPFAGNFIFYRKWHYSAICGKFRVWGVIVPFAVIFFRFLKNCLKINSERHLSTIYHIFYFGTGLQVDSNSGEGCAGFSEKAFDLCKT